jgi:TfoX/Sxy family transcriptional regulator of competence genes
MSPWEKSPESMIELFDRVLPDDTAVERRKMFGYPCAFVNGNMFTGLFGKKMFIRASEERKARLIAKEEFAPFEPMPGRPMKDYVVIPPGLMGRDAAVKKIVSDSLAFTKTLPAKAKTGKRTKLSKP